MVYSGDLKMPRCASEKVRAFLPGKQFPETGAQGAGNNEKTSKFMALDHFPITPDCTHNRPRKLRFRPIRGSVHGEGIRGGAAFTGRK